MGSLRELLTTAPQVSELRRIAAMSGGPSLTAYQPTLRERLGGYIYDMVNRSGLTGQANRMRNEAQSVMDFIPGIGDMIGVQEAGQDYQAGNYLGAGMGGLAAAIGLVPGVGDALGRAVKEGGETVQKGISQIVEPIINHAPSVNGAPDNAAKIIDKPIKGAKENLHRVGDSNYTYYKLRGNQMMPLSKLDGGVRLDDPSEAARVDDLVRQISGPDGYIERLIVDQHGNVIEGQHRLEALRKMNYEEVPVTVIEDLDFLGNEVRKIVEQHNVYSDNAYYITNFAIADAFKHGEKALADDWGMATREWDAAYKAAVRHALNKINPPVNEGGKTVQKGLNK